jgi:peptide deformylase
MARLAILEDPDPRLRTVAEPVREFDAALARLIDDMIETLRASRAVGLAATQVDVHRQIVVIDVSGDGSAPQVYVNPRSLSEDTLAMVEESCLSVPGVVESVRRNARMRVAAVDRDGRPFERRLEGAPAVVLQHEMDHLRGVLFTDRLSFFRRLRARRQQRRHAARG